MPQKNPEVLTLTDPNPFVKIITNQAIKACPKEKLII